MSWTANQITQNGNTTVTWVSTGSGLSTHDAVVVVDVGDDVADSAQLGRGGTESDQLSNQRAGGRRQRRRDASLRGADGLDIPSTGEMTMKIQVIRGRKGEVIGTFERTPHAVVSVEPELEDGLSVEEVDAPDDYMLNLPGFYKKCEAAAKR
jgi:hypothetical protein